MEGREKIWARANQVFANTDETNVYSREILTLDVLFPCFRYQTPAFIAIASKVDHSKIQRTVVVRLLDKVQSSTSTF